MAQSVGNKCPQVELIMRLCCTKTAAHHASSQQQGCPELRQSPSSGLLYWPLCNAKKECNCHSGTTTLWSITLVQTSTRPSGMATFSLAPVQQLIGLPVGQYAKQSVHVHVANAHHAGLLFTCCTAQSHSTGLSQDRPATTILVSMQAANNSLMRLTKDDTTHGCHTGM